MGAAATSSASRGAVRATAQTVTSAQASSSRTVSSKKVVAALPLRARLTRAVASITSPVRTGYSSGCSPAFGAYGKTPSTRPRVRNSTGTSL